MYRACIAGIVVAAWSVPGVAAPSRAQIDDDVAVLIRTLDEAWAWSSRSTSDSVRALPERLRRAAAAAKTAPELCESLAEALRSTGIALELGAPCGRTHTYTAVGPLDAVPASRNYRWRVEREGSHRIGILTIGNFVDPSDPGWAGFGAALQALSTTELVIVDLQNARGDDPRAGFALLAAIGREDYDRAYVRAPMFRDGPLAKAARANVATPVPARSRTLWSTFATEADMRRIAREVVPGIGRSTPALKPSILVGPSCDRACQLVVHLARSTTSVLGTCPDASGDEWGEIRLPHSGIVARFPTASYGPYISELDGPALPANYAKTVLRGLHELARTREVSRAWSRRKLPSCASIPPRPSLARTRVSGCLDLRATTLALSLELPVDAATAERFLKTCPGLTIEGAVEDSERGASSVNVTGSPAAVSRALQAPFGAFGNVGCEPTYDGW